MEMLTTYVRTEAPRKLEEESGEEKEVDEVHPPEPEIQAILDVIGRRSPFHRDAEYGRIDLHNTYLSRALLPRADLSGADLSGADLTEADLSNANLTGAHLALATFTSANLSGAKLLRANLTGAQNLLQEQLEDTTGDENTQLPPDLDPPAHWNVKTDEQLGRD